MKNIALIAAALCTLPLHAEAPSTAMAITEGLTTEVGPRLAGTEAEARARDWAVKKLTALGFANARIEPFTIPGWVRGEERAEITAPFPQKLILTALGHSGATPASGLSLEVVTFPTYAAFKAAPDAAIKGKIVYVGHRMNRTQDGSSYGSFGQVRRDGPSLAAQRGAAAFLIRSIGTDDHRLPHTGVTSWAKDVKPIPAAALSNPDADTLERVASRGSTMRMNLLLTPRFTGPQPSGNVIAELPGRDPGAGLVLVACHLDSWDLGTGAIDDATGCGIITDAALRVAKSGQQRRTIRVLWAGAEEVGVFGGDAYFQAHKAEPHALAAESDFGAGRIWQVKFRLPDGAAALKARVAEALAAQGIGAGAGLAHGGADVGQMVGAGAPSIDLSQDGSRYFDLHHTGDDSFDKVDPADIEQNVAAWTAMLDLVSNAPEQLEGTAR
jgi:hypothetical protein